MHNQSSGPTMIIGGVDRSIDLRREPVADRRFTQIMLAVITVLTVALVWLGRLVFTPQ